MTLSLLLAAIIVFSCIFLNRIAHKTGLPMLLVFMFLGMLFGSDGLGNIYFDDYKITEQICSTALIFIIFYGGFNTNWKKAKPIIAPSSLLSTLGVLVTAIITGLFCYYVIKIEFWQSMLIASIISCTDAASVFSILKSQKLGLKYNTASMLEIESGSNDPAAYMLVTIIATIIIGQTSVSSVISLTFSQIFFGLLFGAGIAYAAKLILHRVHFSAEGFDTAFITAIALLSYALPSYVNGNGYLSCYIVGMVLGNSKLANKSSFVSFFDGITSLMQIFIFFLMGLLSFPTTMLPVLGDSLLIAMFLTFIARPIAVFGILSPFKAPLAQQLLVSFAGLRGASSIVFSIVAIEMIKPPDPHASFHLIFFIVLFSIALQGSLLPYVSRKLDMIDANEDVFQTFNEYTEDIPVQFIKLEINCDHPWLNKPIKATSLPPNTLIVMIIRGGQQIIPSGNTLLELNDLVVLSAPSFEDEHHIHISEQRVAANSPYVGQTIAEFSPVENELVIMIKRGEQTIIPRGDTVINANDVLVINSLNNMRQIII